MADQVDDQCRTCLTQVCDMVSLTADHVVCSRVMSILDLLKTCTSVEIKIDDDFPQFVCLECIRKVEKSYEFRIQCEEADKALRSRDNITSDSESDKLKIKKDELNVNNTKASDNSTSELNKDDEDSLSEYENYEVLEESTEENFDENDEVTADETLEVVNETNFEEISIDMLQNNTNGIKCEEIEIIEAYSCTICHLIFPTPATLAKHSASAHPPVFFQCTHCPVRFISEELLKRHILKHTTMKKDEQKRTRKYVKQKNKPIDYICSTCGKKFPSMPALRLHSRKHSQPKIDPKPIQTFICETCNEQFTCEDDLKTHVTRIHIKKDKPVRKYNCVQCSKDFPNMETLKKHLTTHESDSEQQTLSTLHKMIYKCKICSFEVKILTEIKDHLMNEHDIPTKNIFKNLLYMCNECQKEFESIYDYFNHINNRKADDQETCSLTTKKRPYVCSENTCGKAFPTPSALKNHSKSHQSHWPKKCKYCDELVNKLHEYIQHLNDKHEHLKGYQCKTCGKKFFNERNLKTHSGIHTGERNYMCDYCGFSFHAHNNLVSHRRIHEGVKPYKCTYCPMAFSQHAGLRSHLLNHTQEKKYECPTCNRKFLRHSAMKNHIKTHTGQKDYVCHVCGARFGASSSRKKHLLTHTGERNHVCDFCGKAFGRKSNLTVHRKIHTGETPHVCELCGKGFIQKHVLRSHMDTHKKQAEIIAGKRAARRKRAAENIEELKTSDDSEESTVLLEFPE